MYKEIPTLLSRDNQVRHLIPFRIEYIEYVDLFLVTTHSDLDCTN